MDSEQNSATRVAVIAIIIKTPDSVSEVNNILHDYSDYIIGRMGIPYHEKDANIISVVVDAPVEKTNALAGRLGRLSGVTSKAVYANQT